MENKQGNVVFLAVTITVVTVIVGIVGWMMITKYSQTPIATPQKTAPVSKSQTTGTVYQNTQYGFQLTLPTGWEKYKAVANGNLPTKDVAVYVYINLPTTETTWPGDIDPQTGESLIGYASMLTVTVWSIDGYNAEVKRCETEPDPSCPGANVLPLKSDRYVYALSGPQDIPQDLYDGIASKDYIRQIKNTFQLLAE